MVRVSTFLSGAALLQSSMVLAQYNLAEDFFSGNFFDHFNFFSGDDPTHGYVNYVDRDTAFNTGLVNTNNGQAYMGVDSQNVASGRGRSSVRIESKSQFNRGLLVLNLEHMPSSTCGVWPAFWTFGPNWPYAGEIDIIEGVNGQPANYMTAHTGPNCAILDRSNGQLNPFTQDCNAFVNGNTGCAFHESSTLSYGDGMNNNGGAVFAMEWTSSGISVWWWHRGNPAPADVLAQNPNPRNWGPPAANWAGPACNWESSFSNHNIIFDTTFCGDWAGAEFNNNPNCNFRGSCVDYVRNSPGDFAGAFWGLKALKLYSGSAKVQVEERDETYDHNAAVEQCQDDGLCKREPAPAPAPAPEPAAASQAIPQQIPEEDRVVDAKIAIANAQAEDAPIAKRAAASQAVPSEIPKESRKVDAEIAIAQASAGSRRDVRARRRSNAEQPQDDAVPTPTV